MEKYLSVISVIVICLPLICNCTCNVKQSDSSDVNEKRTGKIAGRVIDKTNSEPIRDAKIIMLGTNISTVTDIDGYYSIINIPPGIYSIQARMLGYKRNTIENIRVEIAQTAVVNFELIRKFIE